MIQANRIPRWFQVNQHSRFWVRPGPAHPLSTSSNPSQPPSRRRQEVSEQAIGGTTDDIAHSQGAFDSNEANPQKSASKISSGGISMEQSAAYDRSSLSSEKTSVKKKAPNTQK